MYYHIIGMEDVACRWRLESTYAGMISSIRFTGGMGGQSMALYARVSRRTLHASHRMDAVTRAGVRHITLK
jgi:hypothetical protein